MVEYARRVAHTRQTAKNRDDIAKLKRRASGAGFDPNEDPVIIGAGAHNSGGTPSAPSGGIAGCVVIGASAYVSAASGIAIGDGAAAGLTSIAIGKNSLASDGIAIGQSASSTNGVCVGDSSVAASASSSAFGHSANAGFIGDTAIGDAAATTANYQVMLGGAGRFVEAGKKDATYGSIIVMQSPNGTRYALQVSNAGVFSVIASPV